MERESKITNRIVCIIFSDRNYTTLSTEKVVLPPQIPALKTVFHRHLKVYFVAEVRQSSRASALLHAEPVNEWIEPAEARFLVQSGRARSDPQIAFYSDRGTLIQKEIFIGVCRCLFGWSASSERPTACASFWEIFEPFIVIFSCSKFQITHSIILDYKTPS